MTLTSWLVAEGLLLVHAALAVLTTGHALLTVRDPRAAWGWIAACLLAPLLGPALYLLFGTNRVKALARAALGSSDAPPEPLPRIESPNIIEQELRELVRVGDAVTHRPLLPGNRIRMLHSGDEAYPAMIAAIHRAQRSVWMSSYIFAGDATGTLFADALMAARRRGVQVCVLIDAVGDLYYWPRGSALLRRRGIAVRRFQLSRRFLPVPHLNLRNHRKLLIVDGTLAYTGGINVGDQHLVTGAHRPMFDLHFRVEGPVVAQLSAVFADDWQAAGGAALPAADTAGSACALDDDACHCRAVTEGPNEELDRIELLLIGALANAHRRVVILTPYFIPMPVLSRALEAAALRGVEVQVILPERSNLPWVDWATRHWLRGLLLRGVQVLLRTPFAHSKLFVVDDYYAHIGSANLDSRSLRLNFELVLEVYGHRFAATLEEHLDGVRAQCRTLTLEELDRASRPAQLRNALCWLFSAYL